MCPCSWWRPWTSPTNTCWRWGRVSTTGPTPTWCVFRTTTGTTRRRPSASITSRAKVPTQKQDFLYLPLCLSSLFVWRTLFASWISRCYHFSCLVCLKILLTQVSCWMIKFIMFPSSVSVTGACFFVFSGALKASSGFLAKTSIVEGENCDNKLHVGCKKKMLQ